MSRAGQEGNLFSLRSSASSSLDCFGLNDAGAKIGFKFYIVEASDETIFSVSLAFSRKGHAAQEFADVARSDWSSGLRARL
jgi:hypothetical protein